METYTLLDFGNGMRLEQWGPYRLVRPDPAAEGTPARPQQEWDKADAVFEGEKGKGEWTKNHSNMPDHWQMSMDDLLFRIELAPYKHTGLFPEQQFHWKWMREKRSGKTLTVLNLFGYTGGATIALAKDGHHVTHVDSSKPAITWAKENAVLNTIPEDRIRWIHDDAATFVAREEKRGNHYDAIVMDPPAYGHGPDGKAWRVERDLAPLMDACVRLLSDKPAFFVVNGYARNQDAVTLASLMRHALAHQKKIPDAPIEEDELLLTDSTGRSLSTGIFARWTS